MRLAPLVLLLALFCGCYADRLTGVSATLGPRSQIHLVTRGRTAVSEGGGYAYRDFRYAAGTTGAWRSERVPVGAGEVSSTYETPHRVVAAGERVWLVSQTKAGLRVMARDGAGWAEVVPAPETPAAAREALGMSEGFGAAWAGRDGVLRILWANWLLEVEGARITRAIDTGTRCTLHLLCVFDPTGDREGHAARYDNDEVWLWRLACEGDACTWTSQNASLGTSAYAGSGSPHPRRLVHTGAGVPVLVRKLNLPSRNVQYGLLASWPGGERLLVPGDVYKMGAAPRPHEGFVAVAGKYDHELLLVVVDAAFAARTISLGKYEYNMAEPIGVVVSPTAAGEQVHVFFGTGPDTLAHITVAVPEGAISRETISLE